MARMYDRPTLGPDGWIIDETPTPNPVYVEAQTDPVTGGIELYAGGTLLAGSVQIDAADSTVSVEV